MLPTFIISFREGLEAFLVVAVTLMYLRQTRRPHLATAVFAAVAVSLLASVALSMGLAHIGAWTPLWEGMLALVAAVLVISCIAHIFKVGKNLKRQIESRLTPEQDSLAAALSVFAFVTFMIAREGIEAAASLAALAQQAETRSLLTAALGGLGSAAAIAYLWTRMSRYIDLSRFFQFSAVFLSLFAVQLLIKAFHEFTEDNLVPMIDNGYWHIATEAYGPDGPYGAYLAFAIALLPLVWVATRHGLMTQKSPAARA